MQGLDVLSKEMREILDKEINWALENNSLIQFQLIGGGAPIPNTVPQSYAYPTLFAGSTFYVNDPYELGHDKKTKITKRKLLEVTKADPIKKSIGGGRTELVSDPEDIKFDEKSHCSFNPKSDNPLKLAALLFSNMNKNWKHRDSTRPAKWERVGYKKPSALGIQHEILLKSKAIDLISKMNRETLLETAVAFKARKEEFVYEGLTSGELKSDLLVWADREPRLMNQSVADEKMKVLVKLKDALQQNKLVNDAEDRSWKRSVSDKTPFVTYEIGEDPEDVLVKFFLSDEGRPVYDKIVASIKSFESADFDYAN